MTTSAPSRAGTNKLVLAGLIGAAVVAIASAGIGVSWLIRPASTSLIWGIELTGDQVAYGRVKGAEDLLAAAVIALVLWRRDTRLIADVLLISLIIPLGDLFALLMQGVHEPVKFIDHFLFIALTIVSVVLLRAGRFGGEPTAGGE